MTQHRMQTAKRLSRYCAQCGRLLVAIKDAHDNEKWTYYQGNAAEKCSICHNKVVLR